MLFGISLIRWILIFLALGVMIDRLIRFLKKESGQTFFKVFSTLIIWSAILIIAIFPDFAYFVSGKLGMGKNLNTLIFFGFVLVFIAFFKILSILEKIESEITRIIRHLAISEYEKKKNNKKIKNK